MPQFERNEEELDIMRKDLHMTESEIVSIGKLVDALTNAIVKATWLGPMRQITLSSLIDLRMNEILRTRETKVKFDIAAIMKDFAVDLETAALITLSAEASAVALAELTMLGVMTRDEGARLAASFTAETKLSLADTIGEVMGHA